MKYTVSAKSGVQAPPTATVLRIDESRRVYSAVSSSPHYPISRETQPTDSLDCQPGDMVHVDDGVVVWDYIALPTGVLQMVESTPEMLDVLHNSTTADRIRHAERFATRPLAYDLPG